MTNDESRTNAHPSDEPGRRLAPRHLSLVLPHSFVIPLQGSLHLLDAVSLDRIVYLDVVVTGNLQAALKAFTDLAHVFLEALQRFEAGGAVRRGINNHALPNDADFGGPLDGPLRHVAAGRRANPADLERLADGGPSQVDDLLVRLELAFQGRADFVSQVVND